MRLVLECGAIQASRLSEYLNSTAGAHELSDFRIH